MSKAQPTGAIRPRSLPERRMVVFWLLFAAATLLTGVVGKAWPAARAGGVWVALAAIVSTALLAMNVILLLRMMIRDPAARRRG